MVTLSVDNKRYCMTSSGQKDNTYHKIVADHEEDHLHDIPMLPDTVKVRKKVVTRMKLPLSTGTHNNNNISKEKALKLLEDLRYSESKFLIPNKNSGKKIAKDW